MNGFSVPQRNELLWLAIDLDGTLAEPLWTPGNPTSAIGEPIKRNVVKLREATRAGYKTVIHTSRPWTDYEAIEGLLYKNNITFRGIVPGKLLAALYVDDRGRHADEASWLPAR